MIEAIILIAFITINLILWWLYRRDLRRDNADLCHWIAEFEAENEELERENRRLLWQIVALESRREVLQEAGHCYVIGVYDVYENDELVNRYILGVN